MSKALTAALFLLTGTGLTLYFNSPIPGLILVPVSILVSLSGLGFFAWFRNSRAAAVSLRKEMKEKGL